MGFRTHDIIKIDTHFVLERTPMPDWAKESLIHVPYAVVTRAQAPPGSVSAGVRGNDRSHRFAFLISDVAIEDCVSPESLVKRIDTIGETGQPAACFRALVQFRELASQSNLCWGPVGSVGF